MTKLCKTCEHFEDTGEDRTARRYMCLRAPSFDVTNLVTGEITRITAKRDCEEERIINSDKFCGPSGRYWKEKQP